MIRVQKFGEVIRFELARTLFGKGRYWTTAYWVDGLLIDSGCAYTAQELVAALRTYEVRAMINTHSHEDHIGANAWLQRGQPHFPIFVHPKAIPVLADPRRQQPLQPYRRFFWGYPLPSKGTAVGDGAEIRGKQFRYRVIYTPGHKEDHLCLYQADRGWLFSGDLFVGGKDRALGAGYRIWEIIDSLKRITQLPLTWLFPGSARVRQNPLPELQAKIAYYEELGEKILAYHQQGWEVSAIARHLLGGKMWIEWITQDHFSRRNLVQSYLERAKVP
ncbi:MAG: MBL fold metallo-hydrolase [Anaerolineales bacterium]